MTDPTRRPQPGGRERAGTTEPDPIDFEPQERAMLEEAVRPVARRGRGPTVTIALVVAAFAIGLVRPWDWLGGGAASQARPIGDQAAASGAIAAGVDGSATPAPVPTASAAPGSDAAAAQTCAYPQGWRSATLQNYAGRRALVWTAVEAVQATSPLDPAIPFDGIAGDTFTAIGWCAPVDGPDRPPQGTAGRLYRIENGRAVPEPYVRLHPAAPNPLGELWGPVGRASAASPGPGASPTASAPAASPVDGTGLLPDEAGTTGPIWPPGHYVIELGDPADGWARWLGLDIRLSPPVVDPASGPTESVGPAASDGPAPASARPAGSPEPSAAP
ncbi:MAG TPA: hypothetical protein VGJ17_01690 [Candidatus Limnocylindrales bacterium]|jgi:hypothetical protein